MTNHSSTRWVMVLAVAGLCVTTMADAVHRRGLAEAAARPKTAAVSRVALPLVLRDAVAGQAALSDLVLDVVAEIGGMATDVAVIDHFALVTVGSGLVVYDIAEAGEPHEVGRSQPLGGIARGVAVIGHHAYVAVSSERDDRFGEGGVSVLDLADPAQPRPVAVLHFGGGATDVLRVGQVALVAAGNPDMDRTFPYNHPQVIALDVSDPARPRQLRGWPVAEPSWRLGLAGTTLLLRGGALDLTDPTQLTPTQRPRMWPEESYQTASGPGWYAATEGNPGGSPNEVFLAFGRQPADVSGMHVGCGRPEHSSVALAAVDDRLVVAGAGGGCVFRPDREAGRQQMASFDLPGDATGIALSGGYAIAALNGGGSHGGVGLVDVSRPEEPRVLGHHFGPSWTPTAAVATGNRLYILEYGQLWTLQRRPSGALAVLGGAEVHYEPFGLTVDGPYAYVASGDAIEVFDIRGDGAPRWLGRAAGGLYVARRRPSIPVVHRDGYVYAAGDCLLTVDVRDPYGPEAMGCSREYRDFVPLAGNLAYVGQAGQWRLARLGEGPPIPVGETMALDAITGVAAGQRLYAVLGASSHGGDHDLVVFDIGDPLHPRRRTTMPGALPGTGAYTEQYQLTLAGRRLIWADYAARVGMFDLTDPDQPVRGPVLEGTPLHRALVRLQDRPWNWTGPSIVRGMDISAWGNSAVVALNPGGVIVLQIHSARALY